MTTMTRPWDESGLEALTSELAGSGVELVLGTIVDLAGVTRAKGAPTRRLGAFHRSGMGASPSWNVFCVDDGIAFTPSIGVVGDLRLRIDPAAVRRIGDGLAWGPAEFYSQDGVPSPGCARGRLAAVAADAGRLGLSPLMGTELEFTLVDPDGSMASRIPWSPYGLRPTVERGRFLADLARSLEDAGVEAEQLHAEYGVDQFEVSLAPSGPVDMADALVLTRLVIGRVAARHDLAVSFSPVPFIGGAGNGAHLHLSLARDGAPLFGGGDGPHGITADGGSAIAGVVSALPELLGVYAGSVLSSTRLKPGNWAGAAACWGLENREAAVRFLAATSGNPHGANVELKCVDPSSNIYLAAAALLASALHGIENRLPLPPEVTAAPEHSSHPPVSLATDQATTLDALERSELAAAFLGAEIVEGLVAVRRHEAATFDGQSPESIAEALRFAWSC
ncbi:glutamine synthetase [Luethyella okanaganae]|uniref:Glutamine synthetase n=1 Tax=Luethyella okanaganae TaxID=69372 RepID=A0ABW1VJD2_9MICO